MRPIHIRAALAAAAICLFAPSLSACPASAAAPGWRWPVDGPVITTFRNGDDPYAGGQHRGIDIGASVGAPVVAAAGGTVSYAGLAGSSGLTVAVRTADRRFETSYLHLGSIAVSAGRAVSAGDRLGAVGTTGRRSVAEPHLHFGVRDADNRFGYHDPLDFLPPLVVPGVPTPNPVPVAIGDRRTPVPGPSLSRASAAVPGLPGLASVTPAHAGPAPVRAGATHSGLAAHQPALGRPALGGPSQRAAARSLGAGSAALGPRASSHSRPLPAPQRHSAHGRLHASHEASRPSGVPAPMPGLRSVSGPRASTPAARMTRATPRSHSAPDNAVDVGWLAACVGLVAAALALGRPKGPAAAGRQCSTLLLGTARPIRQ